MSTGTFNQAINALTLIDRQGLDTEQLNTLCGGYFADLALSAKEGRLPPRDDFRQLLGLPPVEPIIEIDFGMTLDAMKAAGHYDGINDAITADHFPIEGTGKRKFRNKLFQSRRSILSHEAIALMEKENFVPATHVHGLAYAAAFPEEQCKNPIACLGTSAQVEGDRRVVSLGGHGVERYLGLQDWQRPWHGHWRLLGVQEVRV